MVLVSRKSYAVEIMKKKKRKMWYSNGMEMESHRTE